MAISLGSFLGGMTAGALSGYSTVATAKEKQLANKINELKLYNEQAKAKMEAEKSRKEEERKQWEFTFKNYDKFISGANKIADPAKRQQMINNMQNMPFFKEASDQTKVLMSAITNSEDSPQIQRILKNGLEAAAKLDKNGLMQAYIELSTLLSATDNPQLNEALKTMSSIVGATFKPPTKTEVLTGELPRLESGTKKYAEQKILEGEISLQSIDRAIENFDEEAFTLFGELGATISKFKSRLDSGLPLIKPDKDDEKRIEKYNNAVGSVKKVTNDYLYEISGKTIPIKEIDRYKDIVPIIQKGWSSFITNPGPIEIKNALKNFKRAMVEANRVYQKAYREGRLIFNDKGELDSFAPEQNINNENLTQKRIKRALELKKENPLLQNDEIKRMVLEEENAQQ